MVWRESDFSQFLNEKLCFAFRELEKIVVEGDDLYLPTAPNKLVRGIQLDSGIPLQSAAKVPIMITFNVVDKDGDPKDIKPQACIFKVVPSLWCFFFICLCHTSQVYIEYENFQVYVCSIYHQCYLK